MTSGDWLKRFKEPDQFYADYAKGKGSIVWIGPAKNKLYLFMMDNSFKNTDIEKYKKYAGAFFPGTEVDVIKQGMVIPGQNPTKPNKMKVPKNFLKDANIRCRERDEGWIQYSTHGKTGLLQTLPRYKPSDAYCVIGLTNEDLYP